MVDIASAFLLKHPLQFKGDLKISRKLHGASDPERCREGVYGTSGEASVSGPDKGDRLWTRQPNPTEMIYRKDGGCHRSLLAGSNVLPEILLTYPIISNRTPFALLFGQGPAQLDSVVRVIDVWHARHWCFHAGH